MRRLDRPPGPTSLHSYFELHEVGAGVVVLPHQVPILGTVSQRLLRREVLHEVGQVHEQRPRPRYAAGRVRKVSRDRRLGVLHLG